jgi:hypothetical protein
MYLLHSRKLERYNVLRVLELEDTGKIQDDASVS